MNADHTGLSWDAEKIDAPVRPSYVSSLVDEPFIGRPRRVTVALLLVVGALVAFVAVTVGAAFRFDEIQVGMVQALPDDLTVEYTETDTQKAVYVLVGAAGGLGLLLTLMQLLSVRKVATRRSAGARMLFVLTVLLFLPVGAVSYAVRNGGVADLVVSTISVALLLAALVLVCTTKVTRWLRQSEPRRSIPLVVPTKEPA